MSRLAAPSALRIVSIARPFSNFDYVDQEFSGSAAIRRLFSQARSRNAASLVVEDVPAQGVVADENDELASHFPDYKMGGLRRLSFWKEPLSSESQLDDQAAIDCVGWAILKLDRRAGTNFNQWHIFESIVTKYPHAHNYTPAARPIEFRVGQRKLSLNGVLYCQQNGLNKACAQVALRSICCAYLDKPDLTYRQINELAFAPRPVVNPRNGLTTDQIKRVLSGLGINHFDIYYPGLPNDRAWRRRFPYQKLIYSGVECGCGALMAFRTAGHKPSRSAHIINIFGHTFNEDTWAPRSEGAYFKIGRDIGYIPSASWTSSFIGHDDNFGSNHCIPKDYIPSERADYVVGLYPRGFAAPGFVAEVAASRYFYSLLGEFDHTSDNEWSRRLVDAVHKRELILRTIAVTAEEYTAHHRMMDDWQHRKEDSAIVNLLAELLPDKLWMVEVSIPDLFSTNLRKLGELLLDGALTISDQPDYSKFVFGRFPGAYLLFDRVDRKRKPRFINVPSSLSSHTALLVRERIEAVRHSRPQASPLYVSRISLENIRCFSRFELSLESKGVAEPCLTTILLGDNAAGKTTLLRCIALGLCPESDAISLIKAVPGPFLREGSEAGSIVLHLRSRDGRYRGVIRTSIRRTAADGPEQIRQETEPKPFPWERIFVCGYGTQRVSGRPISPESYRVRDAVGTLFSGNAGALNPEVVLLRQEPHTRERLQRILDRVLLLDSNNEVLSPTLRGLELRGPWGHQPINAVSDGYRSTIQWVSDYIGWQIFAERLSDGPICGLLLMDEVEQHLHPKWQRHLIQRIRGQFEGTQLIASTHTPLVAAGVADVARGQVIRLQPSSDGTIRPISISADDLVGRRADQVLADVFSLPTSKSPGSIAKIDRYTELASRDRTRAEEHEMQQLVRDLDTGWLTGDSKLQRTADRVMSRIIDEMISEGAREAEPVVKQRLQALFETSKRKRNDSRKQPRA